MECLVFTGTCTRNMGFSEEYKWGTLYSHESYSLMWKQIIIIIEELYSCNRMFLSAEVNELEQYQHVYILKTCCTVKNKLHEVTSYMLCKCMYICIF